MHRRLALALFLLWEAYWAYEYVAVPRPDEEMRTVAAVFCAVVLPAFGGLLIAGYYALKGILRQRN